VKARNRIISMVLFAVSGLWGANAMAGFSVSQDGAVVSIDVADSPDTNYDVRVTYTIDFTSADASWIGALADSLSLQFGGNEITGAAIVSTPNPGNPWTIQVGKVSAGGCGDSVTSSVCLENPNGGAGGGVDELTIAATTYTFVFDVKFADGVTVADAIDCGGSVDCSVKFLAVEENGVDKDGNTKWKVANQLSKSSGSTTVPEPGTLALLGVGLIGLGLSRRRPLRTLARIWARNRALHPSAA